MTLRARIALLASAAVAVTVVLASVAAFFVTRGELRGEVDEDLRRRAAVALRTRGLESRLARLAPLLPFAGVDVFFQVVTEGGVAVAPRAQGLALPVEEPDLEVAGGSGPASLRDVTVEGEHLRLLTAPLAPGTALQIARSLEEVDAALGGLALTLVFVGLGGIAAALALGLAIARSALAPVARLTRAAERVAETQELAAPIEVDRPDELGRLAAAFNAMLAALEESRRQQRRLVDDAGHELRTPLTSIRANIELLARAEAMDPGERRRILADVTAELEELSLLVGELVDLAADPRGSEEEPREVRLDEVAEEVVERARRRTGQTIALAAEASPVVGRPTQLERALANLLDNACKWNPRGRPIEVRVAGGRVEVRDHGPGIEEADLPRVFDRFYRAPGARAMPGSGLGLAIVRQIVEAHGGRVWAERAEGGGARVGFEVPAGGPFSSGS